MAGKFGKLKKESDGNPTDIEQLCFVIPEEQAAVDRNHGIHEAAGADNRDHGNNGPLDRHHHVLHDHQDGPGGPEASAPHLAVAGALVTAQPGPLHVVVDAVTVAVDLGGRLDSHFAQKNTLDKIGHAS